MTNGTEPKTPIDVQRATLQRIRTVPSGRKGVPDATERLGNAVDVQFNPTSLRLERTNNNVGGATANTQKRQFPSTAPATLSFDLEFDTADEAGAGRAPVDVRKKTEPIRQFVDPPKGAEDKGKAPPRARFHWGSLIFDGIITRIGEELDFFARDGTPLRAKLSVTITEQDPHFERGTAGPGARDDTHATPLPADVVDATAAQPRGPGPGPGPGNETANGPPGGPGGRGTKSVRRVEQARDGESAQQLAARLGGNPAAWRSLMNGLDSPLALPAGTPVQVGPELDAAGGPGLATGFGSGTATPTGGTATDGTAAGGTAAASAVLAARAKARVDAERSGFAVPDAGSAAARPRSAGGDRPDPRSLGYGLAVPLRAQVDLPTLAEIEAGGSRSLAARARPAEALVADRTTGAPWERLPPGPSGRADADRAQRSRDARPSTLRWKPGGECQ